MDDLDSRLACTSPPLQRDLRWWPFLLFTGALVLLWTFRATIFVRVDDAIPSYFAAVYFGNLVKFLIFVVPVFVYVACCRSTSPFKRFWLITIPKLHGVLWAAFIIPSFLLLSVIVDALLYRRLPHISEEPLGVLVLTIPAIVFSTFCEEIFCRGFILSELWDRLRFWQANLITTLFFTVLHWPIWIHTSGFNGVLFTDSVWIFSHGLLLAYLVKLTNSLWPSVVFHALNNILLLFLIT